MIFKNYKIYKQKIFWILKKYQQINLDKKLNKSKRYLKKHAKFAKKWSLF